jgi:hypothetical protein
LGQIGEKEQDEVYEGGKEDDGEKAGFEERP